MFAVLLLLAQIEGNPHAAYERVQTGMTREQVTAVLGRPPVPNVSPLDRHDPTQNWAGTLTSFSIQEHGELWRFGKHQLWIVFDKNDTVQGKGLTCRKRPS